MNLTRARHYLFVLVLLLTITVKLAAASFDEKFVVVFIDAETEKKLGAFPLDRSLIAKAVDHAADAHARGVALKFFFDQPKSDASDGALSKALTRLPVLLQARIDDSEAGPNPLPEKFFVKVGKLKAAVSGNSGWLPLPRLAGNARDIGFVDFESPKEIPLLESYQDKPVKGLALCCLELALGETAVIESGKSIRLGKQSISLNNQNCAPAKLPKSDQLDYIPFHTFLEDPATAARVSGKVVIMGYDGSKIQPIETDLGPVRTHRFFVHTLKGIYEQLH